MPPGGDIAALGAALAEGNPAPYSAVVRLPSVDCHVASASPERFLWRDGDLVASAPIKGTAPDPSGLTAKDRAENVMIVDLVRSEEHTSELQSLMRSSYAVFCLKKKIILHQIKNKYLTQ